MIQTRSYTFGVQEWTSLQEALSAARKDASIWKISFVIMDGGSRVRLVRENNQWVYEDVFGDRT